MKLNEFLSDMTLLQYINLFGTVFNRESHQSVSFEPWPAQVKAIEIFQDSQESLAPKARQTGISEIAAERALFSILRFPRDQGLVFSKTKDDAEYFLEFRLIEKINNLPKIPGVTWPTIVARSKDHIELSNGSRVWSLAPSAVAGAGKTVNWVIFDEAGGIDDHPNGDFAKLYRNVKPVVEKAGKNGWIMIIGTSEPGSYYNEFVKKVHTNKIDDVDMAFIPSSGDPKRTEEWREKELLKFPTEADFLSQYPETMEDFFCVREGLVFPQFEPKEGNAHVNEFTPMKHWQPIFGYDHGYVHPAVLLTAYWDRLNDHLYIHNENFWRATPVEIIAPQVYTEMISIGRPYSKAVADASIFNKTGAVPISDLFKKYKVHFSKSEKYNGLSIIDGSLAMLSERFTHNRITIHPSCYQTVEQLATWKWDDKKKGEKPVDIEDDSIDVLRYICAELKKGNPSSAFKPVLPYSKEKRRLQKKHSVFADTSASESQSLDSWQAM